MPEFHLVESADLSPRNCFACGSATGPFIRASGVTRVGVATREGPVSVRGAFYLCVGNEDAGNPGCAIQLARAAGCASPMQARGMAEVAGQRQDDLDEKNAYVVQLEARLEGAEVQVVSLDDARELVGDVVREALVEAQSA
jgi:hypothetical protein